jgi:hypothetical protein
MDQEQLPFHLRYMARLLVTPLTFAWSIVMEQPVQIQFQKLFKDYLLAEQLRHQARIAFTHSPALHPWLSRLDLAQPLNT